MVCRHLVRVAVLFVLVAGLASCAGESGIELPAEPGRTLAVSSPAFDDGAEIPTRHTCDGEDSSPPLAWDEVPADAVELAVLVTDPDAPGGFVHWVGAGVEPDSPGLPEGEAPPVEGSNDFDSVGYRGPCPPRGDGAHRYVFTVFAADRPLDIAPGSSAGALAEALDGTELARGQITARYER